MYVENLSNKNNVLKKYLVVSSRQGIFRKFMTNIFVFSDECIGKLVADTF